MRRFESVDDFISASEKWHDELLLLRSTLNTCDLIETIKWGAPCYTYCSKNVVGIGAFKSYCGLWFHQGALLADEAGVLINAQEGKTKALRQWRFQNKKEIKPKIIQRYVMEATRLIDAGQQIKPKRKSAKVKLPDQLREALAKNKKAKAQFELLPPGARREYAEYIMEAKRDDTKQRRLKKVVPMILEAKRLHDQYRK